MILPWPPSTLKPNGSHGHWTKKSSAAKKYRADCLWLAKAAKIPKPFGGVELVICFHPPDRRRRDLDNLLASFKYGIDAISEAIGIDDYQFSIRLSRGEPVKGGHVVVEIA